MNDWTFSSIIWRSLCPILLALLLLTACQSEGEAPEPIPVQAYPTLPYQSLTLSEVWKSDAQPVTLTQQFDCTEGHLTRYTARQSIQADNETVLLETTTDLTYRDSLATATDDRGNTYLYVLNIDGYATRCLLNEGTDRQRSYTFDYLVNSEQQYFLRSMVEQLADGTEHSRIEIENSSFRQLLLTHTVGGVTQRYRLNNTAQSEIANAAQVPCLFLTELHPLSEHLPALYGKLLGEPAKVMIEQVDAGGDHLLHYSYQLDNNGWPTSVIATVAHFGTATTHAVAYQFQ